MDQRVEGVPVSMLIVDAEIRVRMNPLRFP